MLFAVLSCSKVDVLYSSDIIQSSGYTGVSFLGESERLIEQFVGTKAGDPKEAAEKNIYSMHMFFFDSDGKWLASNEKYKTDENNTKEENEFINNTQFKPYHYVVNSNSLFVAHAAVDQKKGKTATIVVLANMEEGAFSDDNADGIPDEIETLGDLLNYIYIPDDISLGLPDTGMPMFGMVEKFDITSTETNHKVISLSALMARVDVSLKLASPISQGNYPHLLLTEWTVYNMPKGTGINPEVTDPFTETILDDVNGVDTLTNVSNEEIYNNGNTIDFTFYMFENRRKPLLETFSYPEGIEEWEKQRFKPDLVKESENRFPGKHTYIKFNTKFASYNEDGTGIATYGIEYTLFLGRNHTDNFDIKRNTQYNNIITIKGMTQHQYDPNDNYQDKFAYDARVNIETENPYFVSILKEREHDAHYCVTPMDVYLFKEGATMTVSLDATSTTDEETPWVRMEKIESDVMEDYGFTAGTGIRDYFYTDLVTNTLRNNTTYELTHRDRIYFYIDENLSTTDDRTATVTLTYKCGETTTTSKFDLTQVHLLPVTITSNRDADDWPAGENSSYTIYMEQFEEYLDHYDPLDEYNTTRIYAGLPWGEEKSHTDGVQNNYHNGLSWTKQLSTYSVINGTPKYAPDYCWSKNKCKKTGEEVSAQEKWFLPGITQMEDALKQYYSVYPEFQSNFYWSSAAGKRRYLYVFYPEDTGYGRAVINVNGMQAASDWGDKNDNADINKLTDDKTRIAGKIPRDKKLRIRAFRTDLEP